MNQVLIKLINTLDLSRQVFLETIYKSCIKAVARHQTKIRSFAATASQLLHPAIHR